VYAGLKGEAVSVWNRGVRSHRPQETASWHSIRNARLTVQGRLTLVRRMEQGRPIAHVADEMGISRATAHRWWSRWLAEGEAGLHDRPSARPTPSTPH
jgi:transposase-like protein